jgi:hypothetical protein
MGCGTLSYSVVAEPANGTLTGITPNLTYTPALGYIGCKRPVVAVTATLRVFSEFRRGSVSVQATFDI